MLKKIKFARQAITVELRSDADVSVFEEIFVDRDYKILDDRIKNSTQCIIDAGAHIGLFSLYASLLNSRTKIFAFEPEKENFLTLKENLKINHVRNVFLKNVAIYSNEGEYDFYLSKDSHNHSLIRFSDDLEVERVNCVTLKDIFSRYLAKEKIDFCDLVKMDIEGSEFEIIKNLSTEILAKVKMFYVEYHEYFSEMRMIDLRNFLSKSGFKVQVFPSRYDKRMGFILAKR